MGFPTQGVPTRSAVLFVLKLLAVLCQVRLKNILGFSPLALQHNHPMLYVRFPPSCEDGMFDGISCLAARRVLE